MTDLTLVTGNAHKLNEWQRMMPPGVSLKSVDIDLDELQSDDPIEIVTDKVKRAYESVGTPVIVEDVSAGLDELHGLPGPFIKFFIKALGQGALYQLAGYQDGSAATASCTAAYFDGTTLLTAQGDVNGTVVAPRQGSTFGFDVTFVPDGQTLTYSEMDGAVKDAVSHRSIAISLLLKSMEEHDLLKG